MFELKKNGKVFTSKFVGTGPSSYEKVFTCPIIEDQGIQQTSEKNKQ